MPVPLIKALGKAGKAIKQAVTGAGKQASSQPRPPLIRPTGRTIAQAAKTAASKAGPAIGAAAAGYGLARMDERMAEHEQAVRPPLVTPTRQTATAHRPAQAPPRGALPGVISDETPARVSQAALITPQRQVTPSAPLVQSPQRQAQQQQVQQRAQQQPLQQTGLMPQQQPLQQTGLTPQQTVQQTQAMPQEEIHSDEQMGGEDDILARINAGIGELESLRRSSQEDAGLSALILQLMDQSLGHFAALEESIRASFQDQMGTIDPATMAALGALRGTVTEQRNRLMEDMNRRGLLQSGIWLQMEDRINQNQLTSEQQLLATRITNLQNQMMGALQDLANRRLQAQQQLTVEGMRLADSQAQRRQQGILAAQNQLTDLRGQAATHQRWQQEQQTQAERDAAAHQRWLQEQEESIRRWNLSREDELAARQAAMTQRAGGTAQTEFDWRRAQLEAELTGVIPQGFPGAGQPTAEALRQQQLAQQPQQPTTLTERDRAATADAYNAVFSAISQGTPPETIKNNIRSQTANLIRDGVNVNELIQYVDTLYLQQLQTQQPQQQPGWYTQLDQGLGGWLPWGAPRR